MIRFFYAWGNPVVMSDYVIHKIIMKQSKISNYDWLASADELVDVCNKKGFNKKYSIDIKCAILNCYAAFYNHGDVVSYDGVFIAFNDLLTEYRKYKDKNNYNEMEKDKIINACTNFLNSYIFRITFWEYITNTSNSFYKANREFRENKIRELMNLDYIDFEVLLPKICEEYKKYIDERVSNGTITFESLKIPQWEESESLSLQQQAFFNVNELYEIVNKAVHESGNEEPNLRSSYLDENRTLQSPAKKLVNKAKNDKKICK